VIHGERVTLRPVLRSDMEALRRWNDDSEVMRNFGGSMPLVAEGQFKDDFGPHGAFSKFERAGEFIICDEATRPIGQLGFFDYNPESRRADVWVLLGEKDVWSKGYGSDAMIAFSNWFFNQKGGHRLWLTVHGDNVRAQRAYEKVGFVREGAWREHEYVDGRWVDEHLYGLLRPEYNARYRPDMTDTAL
jgi:ribosomal-protein-alanine N-acetyltransferase